MSIKKVDLTVKNQEFTLDNNDYKLETPFKLLIQGNPKVYKLQFIKYGPLTIRFFLKQKETLGLFIS